jgi:hypothetical protein
MKPLRQICTTWARALRLALLLGLALLAPVLPAAANAPAAMAGHSAMVAPHAMAQDADLARIHAQDPACAIVCVGLVGVVEAVPPPARVQLLLALARAPTARRLAGRIIAPRAPPPKLL